jgi:hypothetical protein
VLIKTAISIFQIKGPILFIVVENINNYNVDIRKDKLKK